MRPNYYDVRKCDTIVTINIEEMSVQVDFVSIRDLYLTPMEALIYSIIRKYAGDDKDGHKFLKIAHSDFFRVFRHLEGGTKVIETAIESLIVKRLIIEGQEVSQLFETADSGEMYHLYHCL